MTSTSGGAGRPSAGGGQTTAAGTRRIPAGEAADGGPARGAAGDAVPWAALAGLGALGALLGYLAKYPCRFGGAWLDGGQYAAACYSDVFPLYYRDGLDQGLVPYIDKPVEYPVLTGGLMHLVARAVSGLPDPLTRALAYFDVTALVMGVCLTATVLATGWLVGRGGVHPPDGTAFDRRRALLAGGVTALVPAGVLTAYINWDHLAVALFTVGLALYARGDRWQWGGGALIGLAVAAKFYPFLVFGPILVLVLRRLLGRGGLAAGDLLRPLGGAAAAWAAVNAPVALAAPEGWATFFAFSSERGTDWGSVYYVLGGHGLFDSGDHDLVNTFGTGGLAVACALIAVLGVTARRPPRLEQLLLLTVAAFLITNKVWSPQFVLWLIPLAVLAWPRNLGTWPPVAAFALWQLAEVGYFFGIWQHLLHTTAAAQGADAGLDFEGYALLSLGRLVTLVLLCGVTVADVMAAGRRGAADPAAAPGSPPAAAPGAEPGRGPGRGAWTAPGEGGESAP
ncbi:glycosyltransferase family 87 protein [Nocardiopsis suaedae]|uniref:DUF2029 domain-containing protein n=1 Tax=Nocardiopsis suaedae TaxID=3018444 RepID=A0ABT4TNF1_9ACTN|nr:hypothetical protein [Nocardiopsis suaedae]MDA2806161.1 hypothetical protein [Nocardiopsis suaedae]